LLQAIRGEELGLPSTPSKSIYIKKFEKSPTAALFLKKVSLVFGLGGADQFLIR
jgi:hypothetical protein